MSRILLERAANVIETRGLAQGTYIDGNGACCVIGALIVASDNLDDWYRLDEVETTTGLVRRYGLEEAVQAVCDEVFDNPLENPVALADWNDNRDTSQAEVVRVLRRAARHFDG